MADLERFLHGGNNPYPALIKAALAHVQLETIHPFLDGNGRIGRLLIAFVLHYDKVLSQPLLYLSLYFKEHRDEYYRLLNLGRKGGAWEDWLDFFLEGVERHGHKRGRDRKAAPRALSAGRAKDSSFRTQRFDRLAGISRDVRTPPGEPEPGV